MKIRDEACGTSVEVTTLDCSPSVKPESRCDAILYRPQSKSFRADMINILSGTRFRDQLLHDEYRRKCEEVTRQQFQRTRWENERRRRSYGSGLSTEDTESNVDRWDIIYSAQNSIQNATNLSESSSTDPKTLPTDSSSSGHKGDVSSTDIESLTPHTQHEGVINVWTTDASITDTSATTSVNETHEFPEFTERELSSASKFNPIFSSVTTFSDSSDGPGYRPQHSKKPTDHSKDRSRGNPNVSNNHESCSSSQELESDCRNEIKKSRNTKECGTESTRRKVATVSPMPKDNDQTVLKILWSACNAETELSLSNQEGVTQQQDTRSHQNSSPYQQTVTTAQSTSPPRHGTSHEARQQTTDVEQNNTDQQHPDINPNRDFPGELSGLQGSTQDLDSQENLYESITSFLEGDVGGMTEDRVTNPTDSSDNPREGDGNQQQERRRGSLPPGLFRRFTSLVTCALRRKRRKTLQGKGQKKKPP
ncbi:hypothetical protein V1264_004800 [Littorina saxatilis]|uniref:Uncharacterized protein n=2 Tax=Littorina saxatilis TaxID=31220 RepID=A0AAN9G7J9_9CAEN